MNCYINTRVFARAFCRCICEVHVRSDGEGWLVRKKLRVYSTTASCYLTYLPVQLISANILCASRAVIRCWEALIIVPTRYSKAQFMFISSDSMFMCYN